MTNKPSLYIPTLYFIEGLPYAIVCSVSIIVFQNLDYSKDFMAQVTSLLALPWTLKFAWAPLVDMLGLKRQWILVSHVVLAVCAVLLALSLQLEGGINFIILAFALMAFTSATQDVAMDGYYLEVLDKEQQSVFVGVRNAAYRIAMLFGQGFLVYLAGTLSHQYGIRAGWGAAFALAAVIFALAFALHAWLLPKPTDTASKTLSKVDGSEFLTVFGSFFKRPGIFVIVFYMLFYRLGDALMLKMAQPFLLDKAGSGGLQIATETVGLIYGGVGVGFLLLGGIVGGYVVSKLGLKRTLMPTALIQNSAILLYYILSILKPGVVLVAVFNAFEQFAYGLGLTAYTVFLLSLASPRYRSGHYAIATAIMALGLLLPGYVSGKLCTMLGYQNFFLLSFLLSIPGMIAILFLPLGSLSQEAAKDKQD